MFLCTFALPASSCVSVYTRRNSILQAWARDKSLAGHTSLLWKSESDMAERFLVYKCKNCTNLQTCFCWSVIGMYVLNSKQPVLQWYTMHAQVCLHVLVYCACMLLISHLQPQLHHQESADHTHQHHVHCVSYTHSTTLAGYKAEIAKSNTHKYTPQALLLYVLLELFLFCIAIYIDTVQPYYVKYFSRRLHNDWELLLWVFLLNLPRKHAHIQ